MIVKDKIGREDNMGNNGQSNKQEIKFPVSFALKAILDNSIAEENHIKELKSILLKLGIAYKNFSSKLSSNGKYISISVGVKVDDRKSFDGLYVELKKTPGIKYAL